VHDDRWESILNDELFAALRLQTADNTIATTRELVSDKE
jgi:hypothetical protein